ncbi:MAG: type 1 glutamine amidotransferase [Paludibacterium sp.]|uniref:type 1 glutamine amidotransferase n=1 Tax=Paludibacterium sp. TaxID=1917523 RepID=UPI0025D7B0C6|nr:type 1 glutamine amidotransferase [Paludibacterium sp.]MBV8049511.1 type 1 glutamine amidotransferase [Paludibacterium sp.]MBV8646228.1 type 1 glutamine amidotransferase [Paludibacterium sp.]
MKPIAIFQHHPEDGPGHFLDFAQRAHVPVVLFRGDQGQPLPTSIKPFSALVSLGGPMSVNDRLDFIEYETLLMEEAIAHDIPILGHCLGGQLLARTLGAEVRALVPAGREIGWSRVAPADGALPDWVAPLAQGDVFQWHNENFSLPANARLLLQNASCPHQAFLHGPHLGLQFHIEITADKIRAWCRESGDEARQWAHLPSVQSPEAMMEALDARVAVSNRMADALYRQWALALHPGRTPCLS